MRAGLEIREDLVQLLQKKLDDAVLDMLTVTLARNNMSKLTPEDVAVRIIDEFFYRFRTRFP